MKTLNASWELPVPNEFGAALAHVEPALSADGGDNWAVAPTVPVSEAQVFVAADLPPGDWGLRLVVVDAEGRRSSGHIEPFAVTDDSPPGDVVNVDVTLS